MYLKNVMKIYSVAQVVEYEILENVVIECMFCENNECWLMWHNQTRLTDSFIKQ